MATSRPRASTSGTTGVSSAYQGASPSLARRPERGFWVRDLADQACSTPRRRDSTRTKRTAAASANGNSLIMKPRTVGMGSSRAVEKNCQTGSSNGMPAAMPMRMV